MEEELIDMFSVFVRDKCRNKIQKCFQTSIQGPPNYCPFMSFSPMAPNVIQTNRLCSFSGTCVYPVPWISLFPLLLFTETQPAFQGLSLSSAISYFPSNLILFMSLVSLKRIFSLQLYRTSPSTSDYRPLEDRNSKQHFILYFQVHADPQG